MNKQNRLRPTKCMYCPNEATGIIYRPNNQLQNAFACTTHATNLFIPFKNTHYDKKQLSESRYRSPKKNSQFSNSKVFEIDSVQQSPDVFFDNLMENIIQEFNSMKKEIMTNYNAMNNMPKSQEALKFRMEGDPAYPYMIINNDEDMMMSTFVNRILARHNEQKEIRKRQQIQKRRIELSNIFSLQQASLNRSPTTKQSNSALLPRSIQGTPQKIRKQVSIAKTSMQSQRRPLTSRDYFRTQKQQKK